MGREGFGEDVDVFKILLEFVNSCHQENVKFKDGYHRQYILRELYIRLFNLHEPGKELNNPLDVITLTNKEGHWQCGPLPARMEDYRICKIWDRYHLSWSEFIEQPRYVVEHQIEVALKEIAADAKHMDNQLREMEQLLKNTNIDPAKKAEIIHAIKNKKL